MPQREWAEAIIAAIDALDAVIARETEAAAAGRIREALDCLDDKNAAFARYRVALAEWQGHGDIVYALPRSVIEAVRTRHLALARALQRNHQVLTTTRSVAEDLIREVSHRLARPAPAAYGPAGQPRPACGHAPITLSRTT